MRYNSTTDFLETYDVRNNKNMVPWGTPPPGLAINMLFRYSEHPFYNGKNQIRNLSYHIALEDEPLPFVVPPTNLHHCSATEMDTSNA